MKFLASLCLLLVLLNVVAYMWPDKANYAPHVHSELADLNPNYVRLNKEIEDKFYSRVTAVEESTNDAAVLSEGGSTIRAKKDVACYRVGPFLHQENFELAQAALFNASVSYTKAKRDKQESNAYRVFLGEYENRAEAGRVRVKLKSKNILDHFVRETDSGEYIISLGIYSSKESVLKAVDLFEKAIDDVKYEGELVLLPESFWLYFDLDGRKNIEQQLLQLDWGESAAKMGNFECRA